MMDPSQPTSAAVSDPLHPVDTSPESHPAPGVETADRPGAPPAATAGAALALVAAGLALLGQYVLSERNTWLAAAYYTLAAAAFYRLMALGRARAALPARAESRPAGPMPRRRPSPGGAILAARTVAGRARAAVEGLRRAAVAAPMRATMIVLALALALANVAVLHRRAEADVGYFDVLGMWLLSIALYLIALAYPRHRPALADGRAWLGRHRAAIADAGILLALALVLRATALDTLPYGLHDDEGIVGNAARAVATSPIPKLFTTSFAYGTLFFYVHGWVVAALDGGSAALRLTSALAGSLAVPATYLAGRQLFGRRTGLTAAGLLLVSHMHIHMSRLAIGQAIDTLTSALVIFTFMRGLHRRDLGWMALSGIGLGLVQYGYVGGRVIDLVVAALVVWLALVAPAQWRRSLAGFATALGGALVAAAPMIRYVVDRPADYWARYATMSVVSSGDLAKQVAESGRAVGWILIDKGHDALKTILASPVTAFYFGRLPMLDVIFGALAVLGLLYAISQFRQPRFGILVFAVLGAVALLTLSIFATVAAYRVTGVLPAMAILAGFTLTALVDRGLAGLDAPPRLAGVLIGGVVAVVAAYNLNYYFGEYRRACAYTDANLRAVNVAADYIADQPPGTEVLLLAPPGTLFIAREPALYLTRREWRDLTDLAADTPRPGQPGSTAFNYTLGAPSATLVETARSIGPTHPAVVLALPERAAELDALARAVPGGRRSELARCGQVWLHAYRWP